MATAKTANKTDEGAAGAAKPKKKFTLIIAILALLLVGSLGGAAAWYFLGDKPLQGQGEAKAEITPPKPPVFSALEPFVVNLQPEMGEQYLQIAMTLQVAEQAQSEQIKVYMPLIRSRLLVLLSSKGASELMSPDGKNKLAQEIIATLNEPFAPGAPSLGVSSVFFTAFVIQ